jgi:putative ABC transport system substrate-binding protein
MKRREFIAGLAGVSAWPLVARAQQPSMPVIVYLSTRSAESEKSMLASFRHGLSQMGFEEGRNLTIEYRFANGQYDRVPTLVTEMVRRRPRVIVLVAPPATSWQELQASRIPVVFITGWDPVAQGLAASFDRPGGNFTGVSTLVGELTGKVLSLLRELVPGATKIGIISDALWASFAGRELPEEIDAREGAVTLGMQLFSFRAGSDGEIENAFARLNQQQVDAIHIATSPFFVTRAKLIADLAAHHKLPATYTRREYAEAGGLMSYGYDIADTYRQLGYYTGRILNGTSPSDLPVFQSTRLQLILNLKTAKALGLTIPPNLLAIADEVIE